MNQEYSDSLFPFGIGTSFIIILMALILGGSLIGILFEPFLRQENFVNGAGIILFIIFLVILVGPNIYNKRVSRFERGRIPLKIIDYWGVIQGLRGAFIRLILYDEGLEIRAFYHRYYIPFDKIENVSIERLLFDKRLKIKSIIGGAPGFLTLPEKHLSDLAPIIQNKIRSINANSADAKRRAAD
jgi:hypothetical protein